MNGELEMKRLMERLSNVGLRAAEQLVADLAAGRAGKDFKPTETQKELNIPVFLVYLLGIVIAEEQQYLKIPKTSVVGGPQKLVSSAREKRFTEFQKLFLESAGADQCQAQVAFVAEEPDVSMFKFTNRILPSKDQQEIVYRDLFRECDKLDRGAEEALQALLEEERTFEEQQAKAKSKRKSKKKKRAKKRNENSNPNEESGSKNEATKVATQEPCVEKEEKSSKEPKNNHDGVAQPEFIQTYDGDVIVCANSRQDQIFWEEGFCDSNPGEMAFMKMISRNSKSGAADEPKGPSNDEVIGTLLDNFKIPRSPKPATCDASTSDQVNIPATDNELAQSANNELTQRIAHLEDQLAEANRKSEEERQAHTKAQRTQKEKYENLIQSLQLRLYISENKVRTYEEALEQHIASISTIKRGSADKTNGDVERIPGSPSLISKVLESKRVAKINEEA